MKLQNLSNQLQAPFDMPAGRGVTVEPGALGEFSEGAAVDLCRDFPTIWAHEAPATPPSLKKEKPNGR